MPRTKSATGRSLTSIRPKAQTIAKSASITSNTPNDVKLSVLLSETKIGAENIQLMDDRVLIRRIEQRSSLRLTDAPKSIKGIVLATGPGKRDEDGEIIPMEVKPGYLVAFNSRWNDLSHAENTGTGADGSGKLERPLSYKLDPLTHLVREADIFGILERDCRVEYIGTAIEATYFKNGQVEPPDPSNAIVRSTGLRF